MKQLSVILGLWLALAGPAWSQGPAAGQNQQQMLDGISAMLQEHPELIPDLYASLQQFLLQEQAREEAMATHHSWLFEESVHPRLGPAQADRVMVVFNDYNCPYCKRLEPVLQQLHAEYPDLAIVHVFVPLRQPGVADLQTGSAQLALGVWREQRAAFAGLHAGLMDHRSMHDRASLTAVAKAAGMESLLQQDAAANQVVEKNMAVFQALGLGGTPAMLIGDQIVPGLVPYEQLSTIVAEQFGD
ncbi:MAG: DsbA family protein [Haliea sp.]